MNDFPRWDKGTLAEGLRVSIPARSIRFAPVFSIDSLRPSASSRAIPTKGKIKTKENIMKLLAESIRKKLIQNYNEQSEEGDCTDFMPVVKLFTPDANATWLLTELNPEDQIAFGLCDLGMGCPELGYVCLNEIASMRLPHCEVLWDCRSNVISILKRRRQSRNTPTKRG